MFANRNNTNSKFIYFLNKFYKFKKFEEILAPNYTSLVNNKIRLERWVKKGAKVFKSV